MKYDLNISAETLSANIKRLINQTYKLLPNREEGLEWKAPLQTIIEEYAGMDRLLVDQHETFLCLLCKLEGLFTLTEEADFFQYRRTIFECLSLANSIMQNVNRNNGN